MSYAIRLRGIEIEGDGDLVLSTLQLFDDDLNRIDTDATVTSSHNPASGALSNLQNEDPTQVCRFARADVLSPGFYIEYLFADAVQIGGIKLGLLAPATSPCRVTVYGAGVPVWDINGIDVSTVGIGQVLERGDPFLDKVPVLLWSDGSGIKERSPAASRTWTAQGAVAEVASTDAVDSHTFRFPSVGSYLTTPGTPDLNLRGDWTLEMRFRTSKSGDIVLLDKWQGSLTWQLMLVGGRLGFYISGYYYLSAKNLADGEYHDISVSRLGNALEGLVDNEAAVQAEITWAFDVTATALSVGAQVASRNSAYDFVGDIDFVRITNGVSRSISVLEPLRKIPIKGGDQLRAPRIGTYRTRAEVALQSEVVRGEMQMHSHRSLKLLDAEFGGRGRIYGTVARKNTPANVPLRRRVRLHRSVDGYLARETWSKADGSYEFTEISTRYEWDVIAWDHERQEYSTVANNQLAEAMA